MLYAPLPSQMSVFAICSVSITVNLSHILLPWENTRHWEQSVAGWMLVLEGRAIREPTPLPETHQRITSHENSHGGLAKLFLFLCRIRKISQWCRGVFPPQFSHSTVPMEFLFQYKSRRHENTQHKHSQAWFVK